MRSNARLGLLAGVVGAIGVAGLAWGAADGYVAVVPPLLPGGTGTNGLGVNDAGVVVGQADNAAGELVAFVYMNGTSVELPVLPGGSQARAWSVNSSNVIVGECKDASNVTRPVRWDLVGGTWTITDLGTLEPGNAGFGVATRINDAGQIVGYATVSVPGPYHGFVLSNGVKTDVGTLGWSGPLAYSQALGINEAGEAVGFAYRTFGGPEHGLLVTDRGGIDITPQEQFGLAQWHNINANGVLGGYVSGSLTAGEFRPATYDRFGSGQNGDGYTLLPLIAGLVGGFGYDINDAGEVVGVNFLLSTDPAESIFKGFVSRGGQTLDLTAVSTGLPGVVVEARDVSAAGLIVGTADTGTGPTAVLLIPEAPCIADFNGDDAVSVQDIFDFLSAYFNSDPGADVNHDRAISVQDIFDFLAAYFAGCN